jgi:hypothetical protein
MILSGHAIPIRRTEKLVRTECEDVIFQEVLQVSQCCIGSDDRVWVCSRRTIKPRHARRNLVCLHVPHIKKQEQQVTSRSLCESRVCRKKKNR